MLKCCKHHSNQRGKSVGDGKEDSYSNQILFSFSSDKDRKTDSRIRRKNTAQPRNDPDKSEFTKDSYCSAAMCGHNLVPNT